SADVLDHLGLRLLPLFDSIYLDRRLLGIGINEVGHLHFFGAGPLADVFAAATAAARDADADRVVGADHFARGFRAGDGEQRKGRAGGGGLYEAAAGDGGHSALLAKVG